MNFRFLDDMRRMDELTSPMREMQRRMDQLTNPMRDVHQRMDRLTRPLVDAGRQMEELTRPLVDAGRQAAEAVDPGAFGRRMKELADPAGLRDFEETSRRLLAGITAQSDLVASNSLALQDHFKQLEIPLAKTLRQIEGANLGEEMSRILQYAAWPAASAFEDLGTRMNMGFLAAEDHVGLFSWRAPDASLHSGFLVPKAERQPQKASQRVRLEGQVLCIICGESFLSSGPPEVELIADEKLLISMRTLPFCIPCARRNQKEPGWFDKKLAELLGETRSELRGLDGGEEGDGIGIGELMLVAPLADFDGEDPE